jgi:AcrR family transcriptional regulator
MSPRRAKAISGDGDPAVRLRDHLVDTAAALLAERNVAAITTRDIARAAGVSDGVLYNYFADKDELLVAGIVRRFGTVAGRVGGDLPAPGAGTVEDNLVTFTKALFDLSRDSFPMIAGLATRPELFTRVVGEIHRPGQGILPFLDRIGEYLVEEQKLGRVARDADLMGAMMLLTGSIATLTMRQHLMLGAATFTHGDGVGDAEVLETIRRSVAVLLAGIGPAAEPGGQTGAGPVEPRSR